MSLLDYLKAAAGGQTTNLVDLASKHNVNHNAASVLKHTGMVERVNGKFEWRDEKPTAKMADEVREISNALSGADRISISDLIGY